MQEALADDRRLIRRRHLIFHLRVFDRDTGNKLGHVVDISPGGMMLVSEEIIPTGVDYKLTMQLPTDSGDTVEHHFEASSVWSSNDVNPQFFDTGFKVTQASKGHIETVKQLVENYGFRD